MMIKRLNTLLLFLFSISYSVYLSFQGSFFIGFIFILISIGISSTIYLLDRKIDYRIIIYIWIAIVTIAVSTYISIGIFSLIEFFKNPLRFIFSFV